MIEPTAPLHVALAVTNLERAAQFYGKVLGLQPVERVLNFPGLWYQVGNFQVHLMAVEGVIPPAAQSPKWGRNPHLALAVPDLAAAQAILQQAQCPVQRSASGRLALFTQDPDGNVIELSQVG